MRWLRVLGFLLRPFRSRHQVHDELDDEMRFHLQMEQGKLIRQGLTPRQAAREARLRFGGEERIKEEVRDIDGVGWMEKVAVDTRFGLRILARNPVFTGVAILTLALGIGAGTAIFSVVDGILFRSLPYPDPEELVTVWADLSRRGGPAQEWLSYPNYEDAAGQDVFEGLGTYVGWQPTLTGDGPAEILRGARVSANLLSEVLAEPPLVGRGLTSEDDHVGGPAVVLISYGLWTRLFGRDPGVVGRTVQLDGIAREVMGVMPEGFRLPMLGGDFSAGPTFQDVWAPLQYDPEGSAAGRGGAIFRTIGRVRAGVSLDLVRTRLQSLAAHLEAAYPESNTGVGYSVFPLHEDIVQKAETGLWVLLGAVGFLLLLVCLNLTNLVLARGSTRVGEMAVRSALGARRGRLARQLLTESVVLAVLGGALGMVVAHLGTGLLVSLAPEGTPRLGEVSMDGRVLAFGTLVTLACGLLFGLFPALRVSGVQLRADLAQEARGSGGTGGARLRSLMVAGQMAVAVVLLVGAGLLLRSFRELHRVDLGFRPEGVVTAFLSLNPDRYSLAPDRNAFVDELEGRIRALPGVESVGMTSTLPLSGANGDVDFQVEGRPDPDPGQEDITWIRRTTPGYFDALGLHLLEGREFASTGDREEDSPVVIINENLAQRYFRGESAVGKRLNFNDPAHPVWREVVGVVQNVKNFGIRAGSQNATYLPYAQVPSTSLFLVVRTSLDDPMSLLPALRAVLGDLDSDVALARPATMDAMVGGAMASDRFLASLLSIFAGVAMVLACVGLYGIMAYNVSRRAREIGLRVALGADGRVIRRMVLVRGVSLALAGLAAGAAGALALTRVMGTLLFGVRPQDPLTFLATAGLLLLVSIAASLAPAWRAGRVDPSGLLRAE